MPDDELVRHNNAVRKVFLLDEDPTGQGGKKVPDQVEPPRQLRVPKNSVFALAWITVIHSCVVGLRHSSVPRGLVNFVGLVLCGGLIVPKFGAKLLLLSFVRNLGWLQVVGVFVLLGTVRYQVQAYLISAVAHALRYQNTSITPVQMERTVPWLAAFAMFSYPNQSDKAVGRIMPYVLSFEEEKDSGRTDTPGISVDKYHLDDISSTEQREKVKRAIVNSFGGDRLGYIRNAKDRLA